MSKCGETCEVFSRVTGYFRPITCWNKGKLSEWRDRKMYDVKQAQKNCEERGC